MSIQAIAAAFELDLRPLDKWLLVCLADYATPEGRRIYPSVGTLVEKSGIPERSVQRILRRLSGDGLLEVEDDPGVLAYVEEHTRADRRPNVYRLTFLPERGATVTPRRTNGVPTGSLRGAKPSTCGVPSSGTQTRYVPVIEPRVAHAKVDRGRLVRAGSVEGMAFLERLRASP